MKNLQGQRIILTGGANGIGRATSLRLAAEGATVGILDIDEAGAQKVVGEITGNSGVARAYKVDITDLENVEIAVAQFEKEFGGIDGLVNNAGWDEATNFVESGPDFWRKVININLYGVLNVTHSVLRRMAKQKSGYVVSIASDAGRVGSSGEAVYSACKGGVIALTKTLARENARNNINLNCVCPGPTDTALLKNFDPDGKLVAALSRAVPLGRVGTPDDYPGIIAFLLSDDAAYITGQTISVSGGLTMHG